MKQIENALEKLNISFLKEEPMKNHTSFRTGGNAELFAIPENEDEIKAIIRACKEVDVPYFILGNGSNILVPDEGIRKRVVIYLGDNLSYINEKEDGTIVAGAGTKLIQLCRYALSKELSGLEFAYGIPGSVGGAAYMNAGAYGGEMKDVLVKINHINEDGTDGSFEGAEMDLSYRHSAYSSENKVITSVEIKLQKGEKEKIEAEMKDFLGRRKDKQPLEYPSAGSVFKRPEGYFAGALVEQSGLKGKRIGGAMVSEKHAGFIINYDNATTSDVLELIDFCRETVKEKFGVTLEAEIKTV
ncbi:MAG: UDP-N-acetylmuramate dehydrogenase [Clostridia bacterium]|nr:UDP-N-acetylmuramate dehydrogenase [Clostridia bacterium]